MIDKRLCLHKLFPSCEIHARTRRLTETNIFDAVKWTAQK